MKRPSFTALSHICLPPPSVGKPGVVVLCLSLAAASSWALALWAQSGSATAAQKLAQTQAALRASDAELTAARELATALELARPRWNAVAAAGALEAPAPAQWTAAIERQLQRRASAMTGQLQFIDQPGPANDAALLPLQSSTLELRLELRHEGHLPALLDAIESIPGAIVRTAGCRIERQLENEGKALRARCQQSWTTVDANPMDKRR